MPSLPRNYTWPDGTALVLYFYFKRKRSQPRGWAVPKAGSRAVVLSALGGWIATQTFLVVSMAALVVEGNNLHDVGRVLLSLIPMPR